MDNQIKNKYVYEYGMRFTKTQKDNFAKAITKDFEELGCKTHIQDLKIKTRKVKNILIGNFKTAKTIIVVPYDNQSRIFYPNYKYYPQDGVKSMNRNFLPIYAPMVVLYLLLLALIYGLPMLISDAETIITTLTLAYFMMLLIFIWKGFPNKNNVTANNLSSALVLELMESLSPQKRKEVAIVFTDKNNQKMTGSKVLLKFMEGINKNTQMIVLYCLGQEDQISIAYQKGTKKNAQKLSKLCKLKHQIALVNNEKAIQLPIQDLPQSVMISSGSVNNGLLCVKNIRTHKDTTYDSAIYDEVKRMLIQYIE